MNKFIAVINDYDVLCVENSEKECLDYINKNCDGTLGDGHIIRIYELKSQYSIKLNTNFTFSKIKK